jgi:hypothetical protein
MPVLLTVFFWLMIHLVSRFSNRGIQSYLFFAWPLTVECWLIAAAWKKRELVQSTFYLIYFWIFQTLIIGLALNTLNRALKIVEQNTLEVFCGGFAPLLLLFIVVVQGWLIRKQKVRFKKVMLWLCILLGIPAFMAFNTGHFIRRIFFTSVVTRENPADTIMHFKTPTQMVALVAEAANEKPRTIRMYSLIVPNLRIDKVNTKLDFVDATGARVSDTDQLRTCTIFAWIVMDEYCLRDDYAPPVTIRYSEWHKRGVIDVNDVPNFTRVVLIGSDNSAVK